MRIVSLVPGGTEIVYALGLGDQLVGVSADSDWPAEVARLPKLTESALNSEGMSSAEIDAAVSETARAHDGRGLYHMDRDLLRALRPDLVLTQEVCEVCALSGRDLGAVAETLGYVPQVVSLNASTLEQVWEDVESVGLAAEVAQRAVELVVDLQGRLEILRQRAAHQERPRVCCLEWLDPPFSAGHWVPEMVEIAGGEDRLGSRGGYSQRLDWDDVVAYRPQVLVLIPCSVSLEQVAAEFESLRARPGWADLPAVRRGMVFAGETHLFSQAGPRLVDGVNALARMLHPAVFRDPLVAGQALKVSDDGLRLDAYC